MPRILDDTDVIELGKIRDRAEILVQRFDKYLGRRERAPPILLDAVEGVRELHRELMSFIALLPRAPSASRDASETEIATAAANRPIN